MSVVSHGVCRVRYMAHPSRRTLDEVVEEMEQRSDTKWLRSTKGAPFTGIGSLEADILAVVWELEAAKVRDVYEILRQRRQIAYTTVMTVMNNLVKKGLLAQDRSAIAYHYTPAIPGREVALTVLDSVIDRLLAGERRLAVSHLLGVAHELTAEEYEELRALAAQRFS